MADFTGAGRSNYVKVTDRKKFEELCELYKMKLIEQEGLVGCYALSEDGSPASSTFDDGEMEDIDLPDFFDEVSELLEDGQVFVYQSCGNEKHRYISGEAIAFDNTGEQISVSINDIYEIAKIRFGIKITQAQY